jgi:ribA/ribD-fused uncharacterized protein
MSVISRFEGKYAFLSNFWPWVDGQYISEWTIEHGGITYRTSEHAFQAAKTLSRRERREIAKLPSPGKAKRAGQRVTLRPNWDDIRVDVMEEILRIKFRDKRLRERLRQTGNATLIEGNTWNDTFWGVCNGRGENNLGKLLMKIRRGT